MSTSPPFHDRVGVVTGAGSGIGRAVALRLAEAGATVLAVDADPDALTVTCAAAAPGSVIPFVCDVGRPGAAAEAVAAASLHGDVSLLVTAAAMIDRQDFFTADDATWSRVLAVNVQGYAAFTREAAKRMRDKGDGRIVLVASINGHVGSPLVPYSVTKSAVLGMVRCLAPMLGPFGIRINSVSPGVIHTNMNAARLADEESQQREIAGIPLNRLGEPDDIAGTVLFLLGDAAGYVTGADVVVDGGFSYHRPGRPQRTA